MTNPDKPQPVELQVDPAMPKLAVTDPDILIHSIPKDDQEFVAAMREDVKDGSPEEQAYVEDEVRTFIAELALSEEVRAQAQRDIQAAKDAAKKGRKGSGEAKSESRKVKVDMSRIGWIKGNDVEELPVESVDTGGFKYGFTDLTGLNATTKKTTEHLASQSNNNGDQVLEKLLETLKQTNLPVLYENIKQRKNLRPVSSGSGRNDSYRRIATDYPSYKIHLNGTKNVAIIMLLEDSELGPTLGLAALYDHADDKHIYRALDKS